MRLGELLTVLFGHANRGLWYHSTLVDGGSEPALALTRLDEVACQVTGNRSLREAGSLDYHDIRVEGCAAEGHRPARHELC